MPSEEYEARRRKIKERVARATAELQRLEARERQAARKLDTRRKLLAGAMVLDRVARGVLTEQLFLRDMDEFLKRDRDRALFGLSKQQDREKGVPQA